MNEKTIKEALRKGERVTLECKRAKAEVPKSVWATYSAFANTIGGLILLGVNEDLQEKDMLKRYQIVGVDEPMKIITDFWNTLNSDKVNENILLDNDVEVVNVDGVQIVCIHVPQADWRAKAIYRGGNSKARNPKIQNMLRMIGFGENVGSGFPKIIAAWKETNWGEPQLMNKLDVDEVELVLPVPSSKSAVKTVNETVNETVKGRNAIDN